MTDCKCNYHLGMGPNLLCPVHGKDRKKDQPTMEGMIRAIAKGTGVDLTHNPERIVLCGSSKFTDIMAVCSWLLERDEGVITMGLHLLPYWYCSKEDIPDHLAEHEGVADKMDELHMRKIDLCDGIFVVNVNEYIGNSTAREVHYAMNLGKPIRWYMTDPIGDEADRILKAAIKEFKKEPSKKI